MNEQMHSLMEEKHQLLEDNSFKENKIKNLMKTNLELQTKVQEFEQHKVVEQDLKMKIEELEVTISKLLQQKQLMQVELETAGDYLLDSEDKVKKANNMALDLLSKLKEADDEIEELKQYILYLTSNQAQYHPVKGDTVDETLAEYINNVVDKSKLKVMFIRINPGIYQFGSKKIFIGVEQGKITIRVGGGYMCIDEFLDQYTTVELEKALRDGVDPMGGPNSPFRIPGDKSK